VHTASSANNEMKRMVLIKMQVYLSLQKGGYQAKVFWVLDKPAMRERKSCDTEQTQLSNAILNHFIILMTGKVPHPLSKSCLTTRLDLSHFLLLLTSAS